MNRVACVFVLALLMCGALSFVFCPGLCADEGGKAKLLTNVGEAIKLLEKYDREPVVLRGEDPDRIVVVTPKLNALVMCSSYNGKAGDTPAHMSSSQFQKGFSSDGRNDTWNGFGAEERLWFAPEGGDFGLFFDAHKPQTWANYVVFPPFHAVEWKVIEQPKSGKSVKMQAPPQELINWPGYKMELGLTREIEVLDYCPFTLGHGDSTKYVGFESKTWAKNLGKEAWNRDKTPLALWTVGTYNATKHTVVMLPFKKGPDAELGEPVTTEYFRTHCPDPKMPDEAWEIKDGCVLTKPNGKVQTKIEMLRKRSLGRLASINLENNTMVIIEFNQYPELPYTASFFHEYSKKFDLNDGGALSNFMNKGVVGDPVKSPIYELEVVGPMMELQPNEQFCHISRTYRLEGDANALDDICEKFFNVSMRELKEFDKSSE